MAERNTNLMTGCLCALGCETLFGLSYVMTKWASAQAGALALLGWRFVLGALVMGLCAALGLVKIQLRGKKKAPLLRVALLHPALYFIGETLGIRLTTASESGAFLACIPVVSLAASALILKERPNRRQLAGILVTLLGVLITVLAVETAASLSPVGYAFLLIAVLAYALYSVLVEKADGYSSEEITFVMLLAGAAVFGTLAIAEACAGEGLGLLLSLPLRDVRFLTAIAYQGVGCSVLAFFLSNVAIARIGVNRTSSFIGVSTVVSILAGMLLLGEGFSAMQMLGAAVILVGVYAANARDVSKG
ncbi:MAG: DMT family transporter [Candidatus Ventricola sp.]